MLKALIAGAIALSAMSVFAQEEAQSHRRYECTAVDANGRTYDAKAPSRLRAKRKALNRCALMSRVDGCVVVDCDRLKNKKKDND